MGHDEHELLVEYSEMTAFNFGSKEYQEVKRDFKKCKETANFFEGILQNFISRFKPEPA